MIQALKLQISPEVVRQLGQRFQRVYGVKMNLPADVNWEALSLMQRVHLLADCFANQLAESLDLSQKSIYHQAIEALPRVAAGLPDMVQFIFPQMIVVWGLKRPELIKESLYGLQQLTELYTSELAMRQFIAHHAESEVLWRQLQQWVWSENPHHRRLACESMRPRLPWAEHLSVTLQNPEKSLIVLQPLWQDPHPYVRKSVANHLNDHLKFNRDWAYNLLQKWVKNPSPATQWIVKYALRNVLKAGEPQAYQILGFPSADQFVVKAWQWQFMQIDKGWQLVLQGQLHVTEAVSAQKVRLDWRLQWQTRQGKIRTKVFKGLEAEVPLAKPLSFQKVLKLKGQAYDDLQTMLQVQLQVNGCLKG